MSGQDDRKALAEELKQLLFKEFPELERKARNAVVEIHSTVGRASFTNAVSDAEARAVRLIDRLASLPQPAAAVPSSTQEEPSDADRERDRFYAMYEESIRLTGHKPSMYDVWLMARGLMGADGRRATPSAPPAAEVLQAAAQPVANITFTSEQVSALYLFLSKGRAFPEKPEKRPAFGWMEPALIEAEKLLEPWHSHFHDRRFNAMNRQFFGDGRFDFPVSAAPAATSPKGESTTPAEPVAFLFVNGPRGRVAMPLDLKRWEALPHGTKFYVTPPTAQAKDGQ